MSAPVSSKNTSSVTLADFQQAAQQARNRPLEMNHGGVSASPIERHGFSASVYKFFRSIAEALKLVSRREHVDPETRRARQVLAGKHFQSLISTHGVPLTDRNRLLPENAALTGSRVIEVLNAADAKRLACQRDAMSYIERNPAMELQTVKESLKTYTGKDAAELLGLQGTLATLEDEDRALRDSPIWGEYQKNLKTLIRDFSFQISSNDSQANPSDLLSHLRGMDESEIQSAMQTAAALAAASTAEPDQADVCSRGFQEAERSLSQFFEEAAAKDVHQKRLCHAFIKFRVALEKATLNNPMTPSSRSHIFDLMVERSLSNLSKSNLNNLRNNLKQSSPALLDFIGGVNAYHEECPPNEEGEALDFIETINDLVRFLSVNRRTSSSVPNLLHGAARTAGWEAAGKQASAAGRVSSYFKNRFFSDEIADAYQDLNEAYAMFHPEEAGDEPSPDLPPVRDTKAKLLGQAEKAAGIVSEQAEKAISKVSDKVEQVFERAGRAVDRHKASKAADDLSKKMAEEKATEERAKADQALSEKGAVRLSRDKTEQYLGKKEEKRRREAVQPEQVRKARSVVKQVTSKKVKQRKKTAKHIRSYEVGLGMESGQSPYAISQSPRSEPKPATIKTTVFPAAAAPKVAEPPPQAVSPPDKTEQQGAAASSKTRPKAALPSQETEV